MSLNLWNSIIDFAFECNYWHGRFLFQNGSEKYSKSCSFNEQGESLAGPAADGLAPDGVAPSCEAAASAEKDCPDDSIMSVDGDPASRTSSPLKNGLVNGDVDPAAIIEKIEERTSAKSKSDSKDLGRYFSL